MKKLEVEYYSIDKVKPYKNNPRKNEPAIEAVEESINTFGWRQPIVVDKDFVIIVGHARYYAAQKMNLKEVPVSLGDDLSDEQAKAYRIADNKLNELATWDKDLLRSELLGINPDDIDMSLLGFEKDELDTLLEDCEIPNFEPGDIDDQGDLTTLEPKMIKCPCCGEEFDLRDVES